MDLQRLRRSEPARQLMTAGTRFCHVYEQSVFMGNALFEPVLVIAENDTWFT